MKKAHLTSSALAVAILLTATGLPAQTNTTSFPVLRPNGDVALGVDAPNVVVADPRGNIYVSLANSDNVVKITPGGIVTQVLPAGGSPPGPVDPIGLALNAAGDLFVASRSTDEAFRVQPDGTITQIIDASGDGTNPLSRPLHVATDPAGNVFVAAESTGVGGSSNVFRITAAGAISQVLGPVGDGITALEDPRRLATDSAGNLYVTSFRAVFKVTPAGAVSNFFTCPGGVGGSPITVDSADNVYVGCSALDDIVFKITPGGMSSIIIDNSGAGPLGDGVSFFNLPRDIAVDSDGTVYVTAVAFVWKITAGGTVSILMDPLGDGTNPLDVAAGIVSPKPGMVYVAGLFSDNVFLICDDDDGDALCSDWEENGLDGDGDGVVDLDLPNIAGPGVGADPDHKDIFLEMDWEPGVDPSPFSVAAMKHAFAFAPVDAGGIANPDGLPGINLWVDTGPLDASQLSEAGGPPGSCYDGIGFDTRLFECGASEGGSPLVGSCVDGLDNDGDGATDSLDPDCLVGDDLSSEPGGGAGSCRDGMDNDGDTFVDLADADCVRGGGPVFNPTRNESGGADDMTCSDGIDNDTDGLVDGADPSCAYQGSPVQLDRSLYLLKNGSESLPVEDGAGPGSCFDGIDNTMDGDKDGGDDDCVPTCFDGLDNDADGLTDAADPGCGISNFDRASRGLVFHYTILLNGGGGRGELPGNDFVVGNNADGGTTMHELGHNLNLRHGGSDDINRKPNFISVMDYDEQFCLFLRGAARQCSVDLRRLLDFSPARYGGLEGAGATRASCFDQIDNDGDGSVDSEDPDCQGSIVRAGAPLATLDETSLDETVGLDSTNTGLSVIFHDLTGAVRVWNADSDVDGDGVVDGIDWVGDGSPFTDMGLSVDVNIDGVCVCAGADGNLATDPATAGGDDAFFPAGLTGCQGASIRNGLNHICETTADPNDVQARREGPTPGLGSCTDGMDNDGDGVTDADDPSCFEANLLVGNDDWAMIDMNFKKRPDSPIRGESVLMPPEEPPTTEDFEKLLFDLSTTDLALVKTAAPGPLEVGADLTYTLTVTNSGPNPTSNALAVDSLPSNVVLISADARCSEVVPGELECSVSGLAVGESAALDVTVRTGECIGGLPSEVVNTATVFNTAGADTDPSNNSDSSTLLPVDTTGPTIDCGAAASIIPPDAPIAFTATATDSCDPSVTPVIVEFSCYKALKNGKIIDKGDSCVVDVSGDQINISDVGGVGTVIAWEASAVDASGNPSSKLCSVSVDRP